MTYYCTLISWKVSNFKQFQLKSNIRPEGWNPDYGLQARQMLRIMFYLDIVICELIEFID